MKEPDAGKTRLRDYLSRAFHYLMASENYLLSLEEKSLQEGALTPGERTHFQEVERDVEDSYRSILARTDAYFGRLGRGYRGSLESEIIREAVHTPRAGSDERISSLGGVDKPSAGH